MNLSSSRNLRQSLATGRGGRRLVSADSTLAANYTNTGLRYERQGEYSQALVYYEKALQLSMSSKGADHPDDIRRLVSLRMKKSPLPSSVSSASTAAAQIDQSE